MPEPNRPLKVFLCHAHADRDAVRALYARLTKDGVDAWLDKEKLLPGQDWELEIRKAVREADVVVVCLSKQFNQAGFRQKEVRLALDTAMEQPEGEIFIIPARLDECDTLESLRKWHWVDLFEENGYEMLMRALRARADKIDASFSPQLFDIDAKPEKVNMSKSEEKPKIAARSSLSPKNYWGNKPAIIIIGLIASILAIVVFISGKQNIFEFFPTETATVAVTLASLPIVPSETIEPSPTPTEGFVPTATPVVFNPHTDPSDYFDSFGVPMRLVPAGEFTMGRNSGNKVDKIHKVYLDDFYIDKYEVTNILYKACVDARACDPPIQSRSQKRLSYYDNPEFANYPVIYVDWNMAKAYCQWRGIYLPTEAQWEKSARGTDERTYPWVGKAGHAYANYDNTGDTTAVGSYMKGRSDYFVYDLAGNVWEWVSDSYLETYYEISPYENPTGPAGDKYRVVRGGSWSNNVNAIASAARYYKPIIPGDGDYTDLGFRCAKGAAP